MCTILQGNIDMLTLILVAILMMALLLHIRKRNQFPGPPRLPLVGSVPWLTLKRGISDWMLCPIVTKHKVALVEIGALNIHVINDFHIAKELFSMDIFSHKSPTAFARHHRWFNPNEPVGIFFNNGEKWSTQRRFALRTLRDFGFGKQSLEKTMNIEIDEIIDEFARDSEHDIKIENQFSFPVINILWQMVAGYRILPGDREGMEMVRTVQFLFKNSALILQLLPPSIFKWFPSLARFEERAFIIKTQKEFVLKIISQHKETFDPEHLRDFIDVYLLQIQKDKER